MSKKENSHPKEKSQLLNSLIEQSKKKGYIKASTVQRRFARYHPSEQEMDDIYAAFEAAGIAITFAEDPEESEFNESILPECDYDYDEDIDIPEPTSRSAMLSDPMQLYLNEIHKYPTLTHKETIALIHKIRNGDADAREYLINCNLKFAFSIAIKFARYGVPVFDLVQQANLGLITAADKYSVHHGTRFTTYAVFWIKYYVMKYINHSTRAVSFTPFIISEITKVKAARQQYVAEHQSNPSDDDLSTMTGIPIARIKYLNLLNYECVSIEDKPTEEMDGTYLNFLSTELLDDDPFLPFHLSECHRLLEPFLAHLTERERLVISLRFGLADNYANRFYKLDEVGKIMGISKERVRQLENNALARLRKMPGIEVLRDFINL